MLQGDKLDEVLAMLGEPETFELMAFITFAEFECHALAQSALTAATHCASTLTSAVRTRSHGTKQHRRR